MSEPDTNDEEIRQLNIRVTPSAHESIRIAAVQRKMTLGEYVWDLHLRDEQIKTHFQPNQFENEIPAVSTAPTRSRTRSRADTSSVGTMPTKKRAWTRALSGPLLTYGFALIGLGIWQASSPNPRLPLWAAIFLCIIGVSLHGLALAFAKD